MNHRPVKTMTVVFLLFAIFFPSKGMAAAPARIALVIGNGAYPTAPLKNPVNDAKDMSSALRGIGFEVIEKIDAGKRDMVHAVNEFGRRLKRSDVGFFYFAGHGMQIRGKNYLVPVGARVESESDVEFESVDAGRVLGKMSDLGEILDTRY